MSVFLPVFSLRRLECVLGGGGDVLTICDLITATFGNYKLTLPKEFSCISVFILRRLFVGKAPEDGTLENAFCQY